MSSSKWLSKKGKISIYGNESQKSDQLWIETAERVREPSGLLEVSHSSILVVVPQVYEYGKFIEPYI